MATARALALVAALAAGLGGARVASAQDAPKTPKTLSGAWSASGLSERWSFTSWGEACGPKPKGSGGGSGSVTVREQGNELAILGGGRSWSTAECWEQMPGLARTSHSASGSGRTWTTRCSTPANDPRRATVVTRVSATDDVISMSETGDYEFVVNATKCTAQATRSRSYSLVRRDGEEPAAAASASATATAEAPATAKPEPAPAKAAPKPCSGAAGEPARLDVSPAKKLMRAGDAFTFRVAVVDDTGCALSAKPAWALRDASRAADAEVDASGTVRVREGAREGKLEMVASLAGKDAVVVVEVISREAYDALLADDAQGAALESGDVSVAIVATGTLGGRTNEAANTSAARKRKFVAVVAGAAALVGLVGVVLLRRGRRREQLEAAEAEEAGRASSFTAAPPEPEPASRPAPAPAPRPEISAAVVAAGAPIAKVCPVCGVAYPGDAVFCGQDGASLVPVN